MTHTCYGAECPVCSPWRMNLATHGRSISSFRDSRGWAVDRMPSTVKIGTCAIILPTDFYMRLRDHESGARPWPLLIHQRADNGYWGFVGGAMEPGESVRACLKREIYEETGLNVQVHKLCCVDSDPEYYAICQYNDGNIIQYCCLTFLCTAYPLDDYHLSEESNDMRIVLSDQLPSPFLPLHHWRLRQAMTYCLHTSIPYR